jgi:hypothetical protein
MSLPLLNKPSLFTPTHEMRELRSYQNSLLARLYDHFKNFDTLST